MAAIRVSFALILGLSAAILCGAAAGNHGTVKGWVLDSACAFTKGLEKPISAECAVKCARNGSSLVILADDGTIYWPIDDKTPAEGQNGRLMAYAGARVSATGNIFVRGGSHAIVIEKIGPEGGK